MASTCNNIASVLLSLQRLDEAMEYISTSVRIYSNKLKDDDPTLIKARKNQRRIEEEVKRANELELNAIE